MAVKNVDYNRNLTSTTVRDPSPAIWADCPILRIDEDPGVGMHFFDDFQTLPLQPTLTTQIAYGRYKAFGDTGNTITKVGAVNSVSLMGGALQIALDTDNDEASLAQAYPTWMLSGLTTNSGKLWFECCYAQNSVLTNMAAVFIGLAETPLWTLSTTVPFNDSDSIDNSAAAIGFRIEEDGLGVIDTVYSDRATSFTNIGDTEGGTLVANTFKKLGFVYDPNPATTPGASCITFYSDGLALSSKMSKTTLTGLTNLDANPLGLIIACCADSAGTSFKAFLKWWRVAQLFPQ